GYLDKTEAQRLPTPAALFGSGIGAGMPPFNQLDLNGDGKVTRAELLTWYRRNGAMAFQTQGAPQNQHWNTLSIDVGGVLLWDAAAPRNTDSVNEALFKLLDTNNDGKLSKAELEAAVAVLLKRDRNDDEIITPEEIQGRGNAQMFGD